MRRTLDLTQADLAQPVVCKDAHDALPFMHEIVLGVVQLFVPGGNRAGNFALVLYVANYPSNTCQDQECANRKVSDFQLELCAQQQAESRAWVETLAQ